ncbi:hypothetical protein AKJ62_00870 [candidate division MSBL1 archaeon SCGC-AAA259D14]|uniref:Uncharacterized protein n=1 Tax=candidate division MSBL1 archaeon SCGC-AAA259D14 TaxID=1698261 RepID=A0A133U8H2_9EURY|nr:hypothetical protein AKJ62_00870 [candidate division MSBL1 archaeon SCGC-AAA259D14]
MSEKIVRMERKKVDRTWIPLTDRIKEVLDVSVGDWVILREEVEGIMIEKMPVDEIEAELSEEAIEMARTIRDLEGYYTTEEALSNMIRDGLALLLRQEEKNEEAERLENSWILQVHS